MFNSISFSRLRNAEFLQFMKDVELIVKESELLPLTDLESKLNVENNVFEDLFKADKKNPFTQQIHISDNSRDRTLTGIVKITYGYTFHTNPAITEAATSLLQVIKNHGSNIIGLNLKEETAVLNSLIKEVEESPVLSEVIILLHLTEWLNNLKEQNNTCFNLLINRTENKVETSQLAPKERRAKIIAIYSDLIRTIDAHIMLNSEGDYQHLKDRINEHIHEYNATLNLRK